MAMDIASVGNHEFERGQGRELWHAEWRLHPVDNAGPHPFQGRRFTSGSPARSRRRTGKTVLPAYEIRTVRRHSVASSGSLEGTPNIVSRMSAAGRMEFRDRGRDDSMRGARNEGELAVEAIVVLIQKAATQPPGL